MAGIFESDGNESATPGIFNSDGEVVGTTDKEGTSYDISGGDAIFNADDETAGTADSNDDLYDTSGGTGVFNGDGEAVTGTTDDTGNIYNTSSGRVGPRGIGIASITQSGEVLTITLTDGQVLNFTVLDGVGLAGKGWTSGSYNAATGQITLNSDDGLGFVTGDLRGSPGTPATPNTAGTDIDITDHVISYAGDGEANVQSDWNATTGDEEILNKPTKLSAFTNDPGYITTDTNTQLSNAEVVTAARTNTNINLLVDSTTPVFTDTTYSVEDGELSKNNLTDARLTKINSIPSSFPPEDAEKNVNADWDSTSGDSQILNKPVLVSEFTNDAGYVTVEQNLQSDWNETDTSSESFIKNKPSSTGGGGTSSNSESVVAWLKNSGSKVFNYVDGELSSFTITATDDSIWTQALNFTAGNLTSITYTHDSGNVSVWEDTVITKTFNYTNGALSSIDYERS